MASEAQDLSGFRHSELSTELAGQWRRLTWAATAGIPGFRRYSGYAFWRTIVLRRPDASDDLLTHELCHVWQGQHRPWHVLLTWATSAYTDNAYELEARRAVAATRPT